MTDEKNAPQPSDTGAEAPVDDTIVSVEETRVRTEDAGVPPVADPIGQVGPAVMVDAAPDPDVRYGTFAEAFEAITDGPDAVDEAAPPQYGIGPFSVREVALGGVWLVAFVVSFFPVYTSIGGSVWGTGIDWVLTIGVPTIAVFLLALRRLSPQGIRRVGSLGVDQFASVAFSVAALIWLGILWTSFVSLIEMRVFVASWVVWVEFIAMLAGVLLTVFAPLFPVIGEDFRHRTPVPAHRVASPARPVVAKPRAPRPAPNQAAPQGYAPHGQAPQGYAPEGYAPQGYAGPGYPPQGPATQPYAPQEYAPEGQTPTGQPTEAFAPFPTQESAFAPAPADSEQVVFVDPVVAADPSVSVETYAPETEAEVAREAEITPEVEATVASATPPASQAFWALAPEERPVIDASGSTIFTIGPTAWALVIEDRGDVFVVRHEDGRIGFLTDVSGVMRG